MNQFSNNVLSIVRETREMTLPHYGNVEVEYKKSDAAYDIVTKIDKDVEAFLRDRLKEIDPQAGFTGEEFGGDDSMSRFWICDPIDGTAHFVRGLPFCTTMLALVEDGVVTFSVIYDFVNDVIYHAEIGKGAYKNGEAIHVSARSLDEAYLSWETHPDKTENADILLRLREKPELINTMNCGFEFAMIASGKLEGRVCWDGYGKDWDYAPGSLLVSEAGGVIANLGVHTYDYRNHDFIASNEKVFEALTEGANAIFPIV